jgi:hypothetical protein
MKEKKGKKSLGDLDNLVVKRSTGLKELSKTVSNNSLGTSSVSISTTSSSDALPPYIYINNNSKSFCEKIGSYYDRCGKNMPARGSRTFFGFLSNTGGKSQSYVKLDGTADVLKGVGWRFNVNARDWSNVVPGAPSYGYLFIYFFASYQRNNCNGAEGDDSLTEKQNGGICSRTWSDAEADYYMNSDQGAIFAVVISNISQINALNLTGTVQSNGNYLSTTINNAKDFNFTMDNGYQGFFVKNFITDLRNSGDTTPIISPIPNPIQSNGNTFDINFNSYPIYPTEFQSTSIYINLKDLVTSDRFVNGFMGSGKFVVRKMAGVNGEFTGPSSQLVYYYRPKIVTSSYYNANEEILPIFDDVASKQLYVQIMKPAPLPSNNYYRAVTLEFTLSVVQPFYYTIGEVGYIEKNIVLKFRVSF